MLVRDSLPHEADAVVIGSGIFGAAIAYNLVDAGLNVVVVERGDFCSEASGANFGLVSGSHRSPKLLADLTRRSEQIYANFKTTIGRDLQYEPTGVIRVGLNPEELEKVREWVELRRAVGIDAKFLSADELRSMEPMLPASMLGGGYSPEGGFIYPFSAVAGYLSRTQELGGKLVPFTEVTGITVRDRRVESVQTTRGSIRTRYVVNAAGAWAGNVSEMVQLYTPIIPIRGQVLVTEPVKGFRNHVISGLFPSLGKTWAGNGLIGSIQEDVGFDKSVTLATLRKFAMGIAEYYPSLKHIQVMRAWAGLRPKTPDRVPILGESEQVRGFILATGGFDIGMMLGPAVGEALRDVVLGSPPAFDLTVARPERFTESQAPLRSQ